MYCGIAIFVRIEYWRTTGYRHSCGPHLEHQQPPTRSNPGSAAVLHVRRARACVHGGLTGSAESNGWKSYPNSCPSCLVKSRPPTRWLGTKNLGQPGRWDAFRRMRLSGCGPRHEGLKDASTSQENTPPFGRASKMGHSNQRSGVLERSWTARHKFDETSIGRDFQCDSETSRPWYQPFDTRQP
jgi:hypothetical protein